MVQWRLHNHAPNHAPIGRIPVLRNHGVRGQRRTGRLRNGPDQRSPVREGLQTPVPTTRFSRGLPAQKGRSS